MALELIEATRADQGVLTHLDKSMDYRTLCAETPEHVQPAFDGMEITL
jgi:phosphoribosyl 1,2-cyclic phosphate phosphodiesterase